MVYTSFYHCHAKPGPQKHVELAVHGRSVLEFIDQYLGEYQL
jgi:hypothetical protein